MGDTFYVIESGEVKFTAVDSDTKVSSDIGTFFQNQFFGEGSLLTDAPRRATATAIADTVCYTLSGRAFRLIFGDQLMKDMEATLEMRKESDGSAEEKANSKPSAVQQCSSVVFNKITDHILVFFFPF